MNYLIAAVFAGLTTTAAAFTYYNVGLENVDYENSNVRQGSVGTGMRAGGYRYGK